MVENDLALLIMSELDWYRRTPLHYAALEDNGSEVERLLEAGADPNAADRDGFTPLHFAAQEYSVNSARLLLNAGAVVDQQNKFGNSPLWTAAYNSRSRGEMIDLLRSKGADPHLLNTSGKTPVGLARLIGNYDVKQFFDDLAE